MMRSKKAARLIALAAGITLAATACGGGGSSGGGSGGSLAGKTFTVGSKEFTEQLILGQIAIQALQNAGATVKDQTGITGTTNVRKALESDQIDMYWEYTGTGYAEILGNNPSSAPSDDKALYDAVAKQDLAKNGIKWLALTSANDTYAFATSQSASDKFGVTTLSQFADLVNKDPGSATTCAAAEFLDRPDGWPGLQKAYGFTLPDSSMTEVDLGIIFTAVPKGDPCNFGEVFATDGRIPANNMVVLDDDKNYFVKYDLAMTMKDSTLKDSPELQSVLDPIAAKITTEELQKLNAQVDVDGLPPDQVAKKWLQDNNFI